MDNKWIYKVAGGNAIDVAVSLIMAAIFTAVAVATHGVIFILALAIIMIIITLAVIYRVLFVKLLIGEDSFCHCRAPWDKKEYKYTDISEAWESTGNSTNGAGACFFNYRTPNGEVKKFSFRPYQYDEIVFLLEKIDKDYFNETENEEDE